MLHVLLCFLFLYRLEEDGKVLSPEETLYQVSKMLENCERNIFLQWITLFIKSLEQNKCPTPNLKIKIQKIVFGYTFKLKTCKNYGGNSRIEVLLHFIHRIVL